MGFQLGSLEYLYDHAATVPGVNLIPLCLVCYAAGIIMSCIKNIFVSKLTQHECLSLKLDKTSAKIKQDL